MGPRRRRLPMAHETPLIFGKDWVLATAQCADGTAWGLEYVKNGPKSLRDALGGFNRADWLIWYMVKAKALTIESALDFCHEAVRTRAGGLKKELLAYRRAFPHELKDLRAHLAQESEAYMMTGGYQAGHEYSALCFLVRMKLRIAEPDHDEALKDAQCVLNNLVAARTGSLNFYTPKARMEHDAICDWLRSRVIISR